MGFRTTEKSCAKEQKRNLKLWTKKLFWTKLNKIVGSLFIMQGVHWKLGNLQKNGAYVEDNFIILYLKKSLTQTSHFLWTRGYTCSRRALGSIPSFC
jgi:hypothetical protein